MGQANTCSSRRSTQSRAFHMFRRAARAWQSRAHDACLCADKKEVHSYSSAASIKGAITPWMAPLTLPRHDGGQVRSKLVNEPRSHDKAALAFRIGCYNGDNAAELRIRVHHLGVACTVVIRSRPILVSNGSLFSWYLLCRMIYLCTEITNLRSMHTMPAFSRRGGSGSQNAAQFELILSES